MVKQVIKKITSVLLSASIVASTIPMTVFGASATTVVKNNTDTNVATVQNYALQMRQENLREDYSTGKFSWDTESKSDSWRYFNGVMLDAFMMVENADTTVDSGYTSYVKDFYDDLIATTTNSDSTVSYSVLSKYHEGEVDSVPMGLPLFDLLDAALEEEKEQNSSAEVTVPNSIDVVTSETTVTNGVASITNNATTNARVVTFNSSSSDNCGVLVNNPFVGKLTDTTDGVSFTFKLKLTELATWDKFYPLISFINTENKRTDANYLDWWGPQVLKFDVHGSRQFFNYAASDQINYKQQNVSSTNMTSTSDTYFITLVCTKNDLKYYVNGVEVATSTSPTIKIESLDVLTFLNDSATSMYIGGTQVPSECDTDGEDGITDNDEVYYGKNINENYKHTLPSGTIVEDLQAYTTVLSTDQMLAIMNGTAVTEDEKDSYKYQSVIQEIYTKLSEQVTYGEAGGNYLHKQDVDNDNAPTGGWEYWNIGLDGLYMAEPFLMECANAIDEDKLVLKDANGNVVKSEDIYKAVYDRFMWVADYMYDEETGLYNHGWHVDASLTNSGVGNGSFWGRGIGWYAVGLVDTISMMPTNSTYRSDLISKLKKLFDGMLVWQDAYTGMWNNVVNREAALYNPDDSTKKNLLETSGSSMMAYALMKAYNENMLTDSKYGEAGLRAFNGVVANNVDPTDSNNIKVNGTYQKSGVDTYDEYYLINEYTTDEAKGTGALIMASTLASDVQTKLGGNSAVNRTVLEKISNDTLGVDVSTSGATAVTVLNMSEDATIATLLDGELNDGYKAYDINLTGSDLKAATISLDLTAGETAANLIVYEYDDSGMLTEVEGTIYDGQFIFKDATPSTYIFGTKSTKWDALDWVNTVDYYRRVNIMVPDREYVLVLANVNDRHVRWRFASGNGNPPTINYNPKNDVLSTITSIESSKGIYQLGVISCYNTWYIDSLNRIYAKDENGNKLYLSENRTIVYDDGTNETALKWKFITAATANSYYIMDEENELSFILKSSSNASGLYYETYTSNNKTYQDFYILEKCQVALDGITKYTMNEGDGTVTESIIKQNARVYRTNGDNNPDIVSWDNVTCTWAGPNNTTAFDPNTAGTYTMTVTYGGVDLGTIEVVVNETSAEWVTLSNSENLYYLVQEMVPDREYIITRNNSGYRAAWAISADTSTVIVSGGGEPISSKAQYNSYKDVYKFSFNSNSTVGVNQITWQIDDNGHIFSYGSDNKVYYLVANTDDSTVSITETEAEASTWNANAYDMELSNIKLTNTTLDRWLKVSSKGCNTLATGTGSNEAKLNIWAKIPETVALIGEKEYTVNINDLTMTEELIKTRTSLYGNSGNNTSNYKIPWDDSLVSYVWSKEGDSSVNALNVKSPGTYKMTVSYLGEYIDEIVVTVEDHEFVWADLSDEYRLVYTMDSAHPNGYIIANWSETADKTLNFDNSSIAVSTDKNIVTSVNKDTGIAKFNADYTDIWYYNSSTGYITCKDSNGNVYYLVGGNGSLTVSDESSSASKWTTVQSTISSHPKNSFISTSVNGEECYLQCYTDIKCKTVKDGETYHLASIWAKDETAIALDGTLSYDIYAGDTSVNAKTLLRNASVLLYDGETDTNPTPVDWDSSNIVTEWNKTGGLDTSTAGEYIMTVKYKIDDTTYYTLGTITVNVKDREAVNYKLTGNNPNVGDSEIETYINREPNFENIKLTVTYNDGSIEEVSVANGLVITGYDLSKAGTTTGNIYYNGVLVGTVPITVSEDVYAGIEIAETPYPKYPNEGAVRIDKTASNEEFSFRKTGVTKVELDVAGVSVSNGVDVVLVVDVSNSMAWSDSWSTAYKEVNGGSTSGSNDSDKIPYIDNTKSADKVNPAETTDKLDQAMTAASEFADILLGNGNTNNNTLSFVTFAGYDADNTAGDSADYIDSVQTVFTGEDSASDAKLSFSNTKFVETSWEYTDGSPNGNIYYELQIGTTGKTSYDTGENRGSTNYDYAFAQAKSAVEDLHKSYSNVDGGYAATGRETIVLFMTDGAPTHYNDYRASAGNRPDRLYGTTISYFPTAAYTNSALGDDVSTWTPFIKNPNKYAVELNGLVDYFYAVGFDLNNGGFGEFSWMSGDLEPVLQNIAGTDHTGKYNVDKLTTVDNGQELVAVYRDLANSIQLSGTEAIVTDKIHDDFTLQIGAFNYIDPLTGETDEQVNFAPFIEVATYKLFTAADVGTTATVNGQSVTVTDSMIGLRKEGSGNKTSLEIVTFGTDSNGNITASSNHANKSGQNIYSVNNNVITIEAEYFTYTNNNGVETFEWRLGDISEEEATLSYYVYLKNAGKLGEEAAEQGKHLTNEYAYLDYIDIDNKHATQKFPEPYRNWGTAVTEIEFYLVNENGIPISSDGQLSTFANKVTVPVADEYKDELIKYIIWGEENESVSLSISASNYEQYLPSGYKLFNKDAAYKVVIGENDTGNLYTPENDLDSNNNLDTSNDKADQNTNDEFTTRRVDLGGTNVGQTKVAFAVYYEVADTEVFGVDRIVMDYGKSIQVDVFDNDPAFVDSEDVEVVGFAAYDNSEDKINKSFTSISSSKTYTDPDGYGTFSIASTSGTHSGHVVTFEPAKMIDKVIKVFTVVKVTGDTGTVSYYNQELNVLPATNVYYETDFVESGVFSFQQSDGSDADESYIDWKKAEDPSSYTAEADDPIQNSGPIGKNLTYGYDSTYTDDMYLSDGSSYYVEGEGSSNTITSFTFKGTGFDLISRTGELQGMIRVQVYKASDTTKPIKTVSVLNKSELYWEIHQIPVISIDMNTVKETSDSNEVYGYGEYLVKISVLDEFNFYDDPITEGVLNDHPMNRGNQFYFDAIRVYNPIDVSSVTNIIDYDTIDTLAHNAYIAITEEQLALSAYAKDGEAYPEIIEVRNILLDADDMDAITTGTQGVIFVDRFKGDDSTNSKYIGTYENIGPNNEVYLSAGQAIAFELKIPKVNKTKIASIDISAKSINNSSADNVYSYAFGLMKKYNSDQSQYVNCGQADGWMTTSSAQYYDFTSYSGSYADVFVDESDSDYASTYVYIENTGKGILSITDIEIAYNSKPVVVDSGTPSSTGVLMVADANVMAFALTAMNDVYDYDVKSAEFTSRKCNVFSNSTLVTKTTQRVESIKITNRFGKEIPAFTTYEDLADGTREWSSVLLMDKIGTHTYTVTGYGADGTSGESGTAMIEVTTKEGGGWQNAKSIYKTLFNCRILSIKRSSSYKLFK